MQYDAGHMPGDMNSCNEDEWCLKIGYIADKTEENETI